MKCSVIVRCYSKPYTCKFHLFLISSSQQTINVSQKLYLRDRKQDQRCPAYYGNSDLLNSRLVSAIEFIRSSHFLSAKGGGCKVKFQNKAPDCNARSGYSLHRALWQWDACYWAFFTAHSKFPPKVFVDVNKIIKQKPSIFKQINNVTIQCYNEMVLKETK